MRFPFLSAPTDGGGPFIFIFVLLFTRIEQFPYATPTRNIIAIIGVLQRKRGEKKFSSSSGTVKNVNENHSDNRVESCIDLRQKHNRSRGFWKLTISIRIYAF